MKFICILLWVQVVVSELVQSSHRIGALYGLKWDYLLHFCSCDIAADNTYGSYTLKARLTKPSRNLAGVVGVHLFNEEQWNA
jgi:hypothetical protein